MSQTVFQYLRSHLLESLGMVGCRVRLPALDVLSETEWCPEFETRMRNRLIMGAFRYGRFESPEKWKFDRIAGLEKKVAAYKATGNTEHLVDVGNYALLEFTRPAHPQAHWKAEDEHKHCPVVDDKPAEVTG